MSVLVITFLSFSAFASGEQPSGSTYSYVTAAGGSGISNYWTAATNSLLYIGQDIHTIGTNMPSGTNYTYYNGSTHYSNLWTAITNGLSFIGLETYTIQGDTASIRSKTSDIKSDVSTIKSSLPTTTTYGYTTNSGNYNTSSYWVASNNTLGYIQDRASSILTKITSLDNKFIDYSTLLTAIKTYTQSIDANVDLIESDTDSISTNTSSIKSNTDNIKSDVSNIKPHISSIDTSTQGIYDSANNTHYPYVNNNGNIISQANSTYNFWSALTFCLTYIGSDIEDMKRRIQRIEPDIDDLHTMFASPEDLALKADQDNNISSATTSFLSGNDSSTSVGTGSIGKVKTLGDGASSFFGTGVEATSLFTLLSDNSIDGPWTWFTQAVADDLDAVAASNRNSRSSVSSVEVVDLYGDKISELNRILGSIEDHEVRSYNHYVYTAADFQQSDPEVDVLD